MYCGEKEVFFAAFSDFFNLEAILINCVYCPKHSKTKAGNGCIPVSLFAFAFGTQAPLWIQTYAYVAVQTHTHTQKDKSHQNW